MSELTQISKPSGKEAREAAEQLAATPPVVRVALPHRIDLPTRYYARLAVEEVARDFSEILTVESKIGDGLLHLTFSHIDFEAGDVLGEFLNHVLYRSATAPEEANR